MDTATPDDGLTVDAPEIVSPPADETVVAPEVTPEVPSEKPAAREFKPIATQDELDAIVQKRLARERGKRERAEQDAAAFRRMALEDKPAVEAPKPASDEAPKRADYTDHDEYVRDSARYEARQVAREEAESLARKGNEERQRERQAALARSHEERQNKAREELEDYDDLVLNDSTLPITPVMANVIQRSEVGPQLAYYLAKNREEAARIAKLDPYLQPMELGLLMGKLPKAPAKATVSKAPEPIEPIGKGSSVISDLPNEKDDIDTWVKKEKVRMKKAGKR